MIAIFDALDNITRHEQHQGSPLDACNGCTFHGHDIRYPQGCLIKKIAMEEYNLKTTVDLNLAQYRDTLLVGCGDCIAKSTIEDSPLKLLKMVYVIRTAIDIVLLHS